MRIYIPIFVEKHFSCNLAILLQSPRSSNSLRLGICMLKFSDGMPRRLLFLLSSPSFLFPPISLAAYHCKANEVQCAQQLILLQNVLFRHNFSYLFLNFPLSFFELALVDNNNNNNNALVDVSLLSMQSLYSRIRAFDR